MRSQGWVGPNPTCVLTEEVLRTGAHTQGGPREDTGRRQPSARRADPQQEPALQIQGLEGLVGAGGWGRASFFGSSKMDSR